MKNKSNSLLDTPIVRFVLMIFATILLNIGLFFILNFITPLVTGFVIGFILVKIRDGVGVSFLGTVISYSIIFAISEWFLGFTSQPFDVIVAVFIMGIIGAAGGLIGSLTSTRIRS